MTKDHRTWYSPSLGREMELLLYGHGGQPIVAFPSQDGRFWDWEGFGMIDSVADLLEAGQVTIATIDSIDGESWTNEHLQPTDRARKHEAYERYVVDEVVPMLRGETARDTVWATGVSMGGFHAANLFFRRPDVIDGLIAISGVYQTRLFVGDAEGDEIYFNSPLAYLPGLDDPWYLERYRRSRITFVTGQGSWEDEAIADTRGLEEVLTGKGVDATFDYWGHDVEHHWHWWARMLRHHLGQMLPSETATPLA